MRGQPPVPKSCNIIKIVSWKAPLCYIFPTEPTRPTDYPPKRTPQPPPPQPKACGASLASSSSAKVELQPLRNMLSFPAAWSVFDLYIATRCGVAELGSDAIVMDKFGWFTCTTSC